MENFPDFNMEGIGGQRTFSFIPVHDVDEIPLYYGTTLEEAVILKSGKTWYTGNAIPGSLQMIEESKEDHIIQYTLKGVISGSDADIIPLFEDMCRRRFIIDTTDRNGNRRLLGNIKQSLSFSWTHDTKSGASERNDFAFQFFGELPEFAPVYTPA